MGGLPVLGAVCRHPHTGPWQRCWLRLMPGSTSPSIDEPASSSWSETKTEMTRKPVRPTNGRVTGTLTLPLRVITAAMCCCLLRKSIKLNHKG